MSTSPTYYIMLPVTHRAGPGHKSHLSHDRKTTLCKIENNAKRIRRWDTFGWRKRSRKKRPEWPLTLAEIGELDLGARKLCGNCRALAQREATP